MQSTGSPRPNPPGAGDPSIRRTWWLLAGAFLLLGLAAAARLLSERSAVDWLVLALVVIAAIAAIGHRNAVAGLEARGRTEAETFARILRGLSRSVSPDAIVSAIMDDLVDATAADHVVLVRRRRDGTALEATLVTRRAGVPPTTTILPSTDLDDHPGAPSAHDVGVPVGPGRGEREAPGTGPAAGPSAIRVRREPPPARGAMPLAHAAPVATEAAPTEGGEADAAPADPLVPAVASDGGAALPSISTPAAAARARQPLPAPERRLGTRGVRALLVRGAVEGVALLRDLGLPLPDLSRRRLAAPAEVIARGEEAFVAARVTDRVRAVFGLSHTITVPLRGGRGVIGAIVLSRREREAWPASARRLLVAAGNETSAALARADTYREAAARASTDPLTGLPNRRYFEEFAGLFAKRRRSGDAVAVLMIDIDRFKALNDTYGHPAGDEVLKAVGGAIASAVRDQDVPARIGGEEFAVLLRNPGPQIAVEVGERVCHAVRELDLGDLGVPGVSVSVGVAHAAGPDEAIPALVDRADRALLRAKRQGRDRVVAG